jgi:hypothetical protein
MRTEARKDPSGQTSKNEHQNRWGECPRARSPYLRFGRLNRGVELAFCGLVEMSLRQKDFCNTIRCIVDNRRFAAVPDWMYVGEGETGSAQGGTSPAYINSDSDRSTAEL